MRDELSWQKILAQGFHTKQELLAFLGLVEDLGASLAEQPFKTRVPRGFAARMQAKNPKDPLLLQVLATEAELEVVEGYSQDPLAEKKTNVVEGLIHKYQGRVLLTLTGVCAIHCRYCFRRHFPYEANNPGKQGWQKALDYIRQDDSIYEVILSGGDPLLATDAKLAEFMPALADIKHLRILRFHSRVPVVLPERINESFLALLAKTKLEKVMVLHVNHAQELNEEVATVCLKLKDVGCQLLNQAVLLKGVNDEVESLKQLSLKLFSYGVLPYYLHLLDKVAGAAHFDLPLQEALSLYQQLQASLPGYLVPRLVREEATKPNKTLISPIEFE